jgi:hypothetical protein
MSTTTHAPRRFGFLRWAILFLGAVGVFVWALPHLLSSSWMKPTVLAWMNRDPEHRIDFADLDLSWSSGMKLEDFAVYDASGAAFVTAESVAVDVQWRPLFDKRIVANEFTIKDAVVDLSKPAPQGAAPPKPAEIPEGTFGLSSARVPVELRDVVVKFEKGDLAIDSADMLVRIENGVLLFDPIDAKVNGGTVTGTARVGLEGASPEHALDLHAKGVVLDEYLAPIGARVFPLLAGDPKEGKTKGKADLDLKFTAGGRRVPELKQSLRGDGVTALSDVSLEAKTWMTEFLKYAGGGADRLKLDPVRMPFHVADGRCLLDETEMRSADLLMKMGGTVTLDGEMDVRLRVKPTAQLAAVERYAKVLDPEGFVPIRITGGVTSPSVGLPGVGDILQNALSGEGVAEKLQDVLGGLLGGKQDDKAKGGDQTPAPKKKPKK